VRNPSEAFLEERVEGSSGSAIVSVMEGTRPILIEVQALVIRTQLAIPRRVARGIPVPKLQLICAVLEKYSNIPLSQCDVFVNVAGGFTITEPAADLGIAVACASSYSNTPIAKGTVFVGEVGLLGEVRKVKFLDRRAKEAKRIGFAKLVGPNDIRTLREVITSFAKKAGKGSSSQEEAP
jgi:DNA repair protein RadA/Sms